MLKWVTDTLQAASMGPAALPLAFLLGLVSAVASACCTLPAMGMLVAYSGSRETVDRRSAFRSAVWFLAGTTLALMILGFVAGWVGQTAQAFLGRYWKLFAGGVAVLFGLATLKLLPFKLPSRARKEGALSASGGKMGAALGGLILGGGVAACSLPCNPGIFIVIGASVLMGKIVWGMLLMAAFAVGFSLTEGIINRPSDVLDISVIEREKGLELAMIVNQECYARLENQRRNLVGRTGCGLCGAESLEQAMRNPAVVASQVEAPVIGIPLEAGSLSGIDALLSILQLPKGVPVATMGIGKQGVINAVLLAERIVKAQSR